MENHPPYRVALLATPPTACPLAAALQDTTTRLQPLAEKAGLPGFSLSTSRDFSAKAGWYEGYSLSARPLSACWTEDKGIRTFTAPTLAEAEVQFLSLLRDYEQMAYDADPARRGEQLCEMYQELGGQGCAA